MNSSENCLGAEEWEEEVRLDLGSELGASSHEEAVPHEIVVWEVMSRKTANLPSISITGGAAGSRSI